MSPDHIARSGDRATFQCALTSYRIHVYASLKNFTASVSSRTVALRGNPGYGNDLI